MRVPLRFLPWLVILALGVLLWWILQLPEAPATWLDVEAPREAVAGRPFTVRVTVRPDSFPRHSPPMLLIVDVHGQNAYRDTLGYLSGTAPQRVTRGDGPHTFTINLPARDELSFVNVVAYLSPSGHWRDRVVEAGSEALPYRREAGAESGPDFAPLAMHETHSDPTVVRGDVTAVRFVLVAGWILFAWLRWRSPAPASRNGRRLLPSLALIAAAWEWLPLEATLGARARAFASIHHWYAMRSGFQQVFTAAIASAAAALILLVWRRARGPGRGLAAIGFTVYAAVTLAAFLSLHSVDAVLAIPVFSVPLIQVVQLGALALALVGAAVTRRHPR